MMNLFNDVSVNLFPRTSLSDSAPSTTKLNTLTAENEILNFYAEST